MADITPQPDKLEGKKIIVALTGGIACYKIATLVSRLVQSKAAVVVLMTESAARFVAPLTFQTLSGRPVLTSQWDVDGHHESQHIGSARWADMVVVAPASANTIAKVAHGLADNVVTTTLLALPRQTPVLVAPAMNEQMWENPVTQANVERVRSLLGYALVGPASGWQACRTSGAGRMAEPTEIFAQIIETVG